MSPYCPCAVVHLFEDAEPPWLQLQLFGLDPGCHVVGLSACRPDTRRLRVGLPGGFVLLNRLPRG